MKNIATWVRNVYEKNPEFREKISWRVRYLDEAIKNTKDIESSDINYLDTHPHKSDLAILLANVPAKYITKHLGEEITFWTYVHYPYIAEEIREKMSSELNIPKNTLEKCRLSEWRFHYKARTKNIIDLYSLITYVNEEFFNRDISEKISKHWKEEFSKDKIPNYTIIPLNTINSYHISRVEEWTYKEYGKVGNQTIVIPIYLDGPIGIGLLYKGEPIAITSYMVDDGILMIHQLQGLQKKLLEHNELVGSIPTRPLMPLNWKEFLVDLSTDLAREQSFYTLGIRGAKNNPWTKKDPDTGKIHLPLKNAKIIYDQFAKSNGFTQRENKNWYKKL